MTFEKGSKLKGRPKFWKKKRARPSSPNPSLQQEDTENIDNEKSKRVRWEATDNEDRIEDEDKLSISNNAISASEAEESESVPLGKVLPRQSISATFP